MANDRGTRSAAPVSPDYPAKTNSRRTGRAAARSIFKRAAVGIAGRRRWSRPALEAGDEFAGAEAGIEDAFHRALMSLRHLPRHERSHALRAAKEQRLLALRSLRDDRGRARNARRLRQRSRAPAPR